MQGQDAGLHVLAITAQIIHITEDAGLHMVAVNAHITPTMTGVARAGYRVTYSHHLYNPRAPD